MLKRKSNSEHLTEGYGFPRTRLRRNRSSQWLRRLVAENNISNNDLILPLFVQEGKKLSTEIKLMPGVNRLSIDYLVEKAEEAKNLGIPAVAIFPVVGQNKKTADATEALNKKNLMCRAISAVKRCVPDIGIIADVALDPYTSHGHDGVLSDGDVENEKTVNILSKQAVIQAEAGCDIIAPSDMMDGRVGAIRDVLDSNGLKNVKIMSYSAKYASSFYGPFREAVGSANNLGKADKKTYQMDPSNSDEAIREVMLDIKEGADMVMIKPGMPYLDIISRVKQEFNIPVFAYQVSGEYSMMKAAAENGYVDFNEVMIESLLAFKRAGASGIFTYAAIEVAKLLKGEKQ